MSELLAEKLEQISWKFNDSISVLPENIYISARMSLIRVTKNCFFDKYKKKTLWKSEILLLYFCEIIEQKKEFNTNK